VRSLTAGHSRRTGSSTLEQSSTATARSRTTFSNR
jgi:hypothetical protein